MTNITITIDFDAMNPQSGVLALQEITETISGLANSLRTQVNDVHVNVKTEDK